MAAIDSTMPNAPPSPSRHETTSPAPPNCTAQLAIPDHGLPNEHPVLLASTNEPSLELSAKVEGFGIPASAPSSSLPLSQLPRISVADLVAEDGSPTSSYARASESLFLSLAKFGAAVLEPTREDTDLLSWTLVSSRSYFRDADYKGKGNEANDRYLYKAGSEATDTVTPPGLRDSFKCMGRVSRLALSALARHLKLRSDHFSGMLDDCPLAHGEFSSSVLTASRLRRVADSKHVDDVNKTVSPSATLRPAETVKGFFALVTSELPGLEVRNTDGSWNFVDQGVRPGALVLLPGECLFRATGGYWPPSTFRAVEGTSSARSSRYSLTFELVPRPNAVIDCNPLLEVGHTIPSTMREVILAGAFMESLSKGNSALQLGKDLKLVSVRKPEKTKVSAMLSDPISGSLLEDAMVAQCGHSFGGATLKRVVESMLCPYCMARVDVMTLVPNLAVRAAASLFRSKLGDSGPKPIIKPCKRKRQDASDGKALIESARRLKASNAQCGTSLRLGSPEGDHGNRVKGVQFPFAVYDRVLIKGNKRTPEKFVGREAVITTQCLNGWYLVRTVDTGESVRLQYRSLEKLGVATESQLVSMGLPVVPVAAVDNPSDGLQDDFQARADWMPCNGSPLDTKGGSESMGKEWWRSKPAAGEMTALLEDDDTEKKVLPVPKLTSPTLDGNKATLSCSPLHSQTPPSSVHAQKTAAGIRPTPEAEFLSSQLPQKAPDNTMLGPPAKNQMCSPLSLKLKVYRGSPEAKPLSKETQALFDAAAVLAGGPRAVPGSEQHADPGVGSMLSLEQPSRGSGSSPSKTTDESEVIVRRSLPLWMSPGTATNILTQAIEAEARMSDTS